MAGLRPVEHAGARGPAARVSSTEALPEDFLDLLEHRVDFLVVGAHALAAHGFPRFTKDIDLFLRPTPANAERVMAALVGFGAPIQAHGVSARDFATPGTVYQMGLPPRRVDLTTEISGVSYSEAAAGAMTKQLAGLELRFLGLDELVRNKRAAGRTRDLLDVAMLVEAGVAPAEPKPEES